MCRLYFRIFTIMTVMLLFICSVCDLVLATDNNEFSFAAPMPTGNTIHDSWSADGSTFFFVGDGGTILQYSNDNWDVMDTPTVSALYGIHGTSINDIWAVGGNSYGESDAEKSVILHYNGTSWLSVTPPDYLGYFYVMQDVFAAASGDVWAVSKSSSYLWHYNGTGWSFVDTGIVTTLPYDFYAVYGFSSNDIYVAGGCNTVLHYDGTNWIKEHQISSCNPDFVTNMLYDVWGTGTDNVYTCGNSNQILKRQNTTPATWTEIHAPNGAGDAVPLNAIGGTGEDIYFAGSGGEIWEYNGTEFTTVSAGATSTLYSIINKSTGDYIVTGDHGTANSFNGTTQTPLNTVAEPNKNFLFGSYHNYTLWLSPSALSSTQGIYTFDGGSFTEHFIPLGTETQATVTSLDSVADNDVWLGLQASQGIIKRYDGATWSDYTPPGRADHPGLRDVLKSSSGSYFVILEDVNSGQRQPCKILQNSTECYTEPSDGYTLYYAITEADDGTIYAAGINGSVISYNNSTWSEETTGTTVDLTAITAGGGWVYAVGADRTAIFKQTGQSWLPVTGLTTRASNSFIDVIYGGNGISYATLKTPTQFIGGGKGYIYSFENGIATMKVGGSSMSYNKLATDKSGMTIVVGNNGMLFGKGMQDFLLPSLTEAIKILQILCDIIPENSNYLDMTENGKADMGDVISILNSYLR